MVFLLYRLTKWSTMLIFYVGHLRAPYRFAHFLPADSPNLPVRAVMTKALMSLYSTTFYIFLKTVRRYFAQLNKNMMDV